MLGRIRVAGHSMEPALQSGDEILFIRVPPHIGSVVVARDPRDAERLLIKRVAAIQGDDVTLESDRPDHERVRVDRRAILGRAILRYHPVSRTSVVPGRAGQRTRARDRC